MQRNYVENLVIGAGLAGLSCAVRLREAGREVLVLESSDDVGGRVRTDRVDGFLLDRGFQVFLDSYPEAGRFLDLPALRLKAFEPGAVIWKDGELQTVMDVFRRPAAFFDSAFATVGSIRDKLLVAKLRSRVLGKSIDSIWAAPEVTTLEYLRSYGFSEDFITEFFRCFYGGIFLERELSTSSRFFEFTFKMFSSGSATLPAEGMQAIPRQLAARLPTEAIRLETTVETIGPGRVDTRETEFRAQNIVLAVDGENAARLTNDSAPRWNGTTCLYFSAESDPVGMPILLLKGNRPGLINHVCVPSSVAPGYAPEGKSLISVSLTDDINDPDLTQRVVSELHGWFGARVSSWTHLRTDSIQKALPKSPPGHGETTVTSAEGILVCGDHTRSASIEGAIISGLLAAKKIID